MNKLNLLQNLMTQKLNYLKNIPKNRKTQYNTLYFHDFTSQEQSKIISYFPNVDMHKSNQTFGHEYILNSLDEYDLMLFSNVDSYICSIEFVTPFIDILTQQGEMWFFINKTNDILEGNKQTRQFENMLYENNIRFLKNTLYHEDYPLDIITIKKQSNKIVIRHV